MSVSRTLGHVKNLCGMLWIKVFRKCYPRRPTMRLGAYLHWTQNGRTHSYHVDRPVTTLGRHTSNDIVLKGKEVSRFHARIELDSNGGFTVTDTGSSNRTYLNGKNVQSGRLEGGSVIRIGATRLQFSILDDDPEKWGDHEIFSSSLQSTTTSSDLDEATGQSETVDTEFRETHNTTSVTIRYYIMDTGWKQAVARELSTDGAFIETRNKKLKPGSWLKVILPTIHLGQKRWVQLDGRITQCTPDGIRLRFEDCDYTSREILASYDKAA